MPVQLHPGGAGESLGDAMLVNAPLYTPGFIWYVNSAIGVDAASPRGRDRTRPLATLAQAQANGANGDIVVLMDGHAETFTAALAITKSLTIVGAGSSGGKPTVKMTNNSAAAGQLTVSGARVQLRNIWFEENAQTNAVGRITVSGAGFSMVGCYVECGATDTAGGLVLTTGADYALVKNTTFISTATTLAAQPYSGITVNSSLNGLYLDGVTFDGGTKGWSSYYAFYGNGALTGFKFENISLLRGSDMLMPDPVASVALGYMAGITPTGGGAVIEWTAGG